MFILESRVNELIKDLGFIFILHAHERRKKMPL